MTRHILLAAVIAGTLGATPALAADGPPVRDYKAVADKPVAEIDPALSYIIVRTQTPTAMTFVRRPEKEDIDDYFARRGAALAKAHEKWAKKHANWIKAAADWDKAPPAGRGVRPPEPIEPTDANLAFPAIEQEGMFMVGPFNRFAKSKEVSVFVHRVPPGHYIFYGPASTLPAAGTCLCMGSIAFEVKPGQIVDAGQVIGNWLAERAKAKAEGRPVPKSDMDLPETMTSTTWIPPVAGDPIDPRLSGFTIVPADLHASGRIPNYYGLQIDRLTPIPGILAYDRDRVIDLKAAPAG